jgi:poly-D-alanine transfer protein DltD
MCINEKIMDHYNSNWENLQTSLKRLDADKYTNPLLITFDEDKLNKSDFKVMIFGQETKGWYDKDGVLESPADLVKRYDSFFNKEKFYPGFGKSSFWKAYRLFKKRITSRLSDKTIYFCWNNINKIGKSKGKTGVSNDVRCIERKYFSIIKSEVKLFKPDIVIFLTGPYRDEDIKHHFEDANFMPINSDFKTRDLAKVVSEHLPERSIRIYHPSYYAGFNNVLKGALDEILS